MHDQILSAVARVLGFTGWKFSNEFEVKFELFHQLARLSVDGVRLGDRVPETPSCRLHAEGKIMNGNRRKADLLICDPTRRQAFNYEVERVIELKKTLTVRALREEIEKLQSYNRRFEGFYVIAPDAATGLQAPKLINDTPVHVLHAASALSISEPDFLGDESLELGEVIRRVQGCIDAALELYGSGRDQYHSFYWCNYEDERWRKHSFPSEGDFNAQLYHALRTTLPSSVEIRSEVRPPRDPLRRVDLLVRDRGGRWGIPIDIKMNWDQFKPSFKQGKPEDPEAVIIMNRLRNLGASYPAWYAILVVIQGDWRLPRDIRSRALPLLESCVFPLELVSYSEDRNCVSRRQLGVVST